MKIKKTSGLNIYVPALILITLYMAACSAGLDSRGRVEVSRPQNSSTTEVPNFGIPSNTGPTKSNGGVDVGNLTTYLVPTTQVALNAGSDWVQSTDPAKLDLKAKDSSSIKGEVKQIANLVSPNLQSLKLHLAETHQGQKIEQRSMNGTPALEIKRQNDENGLKSEIYLINEGRNVVVITADLKKDSLVSGKEVLASTRILYQGEPIPGQQSRTVTLYNRKNDMNGKNYAYALGGDCFPFADNGCNGFVALGFQGYWKKLWLDVGLGGYDDGLIVDLGSESETPFNSIRVEAPFLIAKGENVPLSKIYSLFTPKTLTPQTNRINPIEGHVYLVRTISWPDEDMISKIKVNKIDSDTITITYERLLQIPKKVLQARVDAAIKYTKEFEMPKDRGEVVLYSRTAFGAYSYSAFNFEFSTSGNHWITRNSWHVMFDRGGDGKPGLSSSNSGSGLSRIHSLPSSKDFNSITRTDFPNPNTSTERHGLPITIGGIYLIDAYEYNLENNHVMGAIKVLDIDKDNKWVRVEFRRILVETTKDFVQWLPLPVDPAVVTTELELNSDSRKASYNPFDRVRGDVKSYYQESIGVRDRSQQKESLWLRVDSRPYANRGFRKLTLENPKLFETMNLAEAQKQMTTIPASYTVEITKGDVFVVDLKNFYSHVTLLIRIDEITPEKEIKISVRDLYKAKAPFETDLK